MMHVFSRLLFCFLLYYLCILPTRATEADGPLRHLRTIDGIEEYVLPANGLRVLLMPNEGLPVATVMVTYKVGSRHEVAGTTGATHILEHMMFKGTPRFNTETGNDYATVMERIGARSNATTWFDRTNYYATLPSKSVPLAIEMEADRMRNLMIREEDLASEMTVVRNEYERGENNPISTLIKELFAAAFVAHTYSHPTIGWKSDIESTTPDKLRAFYDTYYWPENAVLTIIGGFDREATLQAIVKHYGSIPSAPQPIPVLETTEPEQIGARRVTVERAGQIGVVMVGYKVPEATHEDWAALLLIDQIVGADKTGRLYRALEDKGKASATFSFAPELHDPGLFVLGAYLTPDATHEEVESILNKEIERLIRGGVTDEELQRAKSVLRADLIYGRDGPYAIADQINEAIAMGDWTQYVKRPQAIEAVNASQIQAVASRYFSPQKSTTGWFIPQRTQLSLSSRGGHLPGPHYFRDPDLFAPYYYMTEGIGTETSSKVVGFTPGMRRESVVGIDVITIDMPIDGVVSFVGSFAAGEAFSPEGQPMLANLTASMLDKGTKRRDRFAIAELLDTLGANISFTTDSHSLSFSGRFLRPDAGTVLATLAEQLREPALDPEVFESVRQRVTANLLLAGEDPAYQASSQMSRRLYPAMHPNRSEELESLLNHLKSVSVEELRKFHQTFYGPHSMCLVFAGDIDFEQIKASVANAFDGWNGGVSYSSNIPAQNENDSSEDRIYLADKTSAHVQFGYNTGLQRSQEDYLPFMVGNFILGGSFNARLMGEIRKNRGLTYDIRSFHEGDILTAGNWTLSASFSPALLDQGLEATRSVVKDWFENGVSDEEVAATIDTLTGSYLVGLSTTARVAGQVHSFILRGHSLDYIDLYPQKLREITTAQVNLAIKKYFNPSKTRVIMAGSLEKKQTTDPIKSDPIRVTMDAPDAGWRIQIDQIYRTAGQLIVISNLTRTAETAAQVITAVSDSVNLPTPITLPVRHYILGKTWNWGDTGDYQFLKSIDEIKSVLVDAERIYPL